MKPLHPSVIAAQPPRASRLADLFDPATVVLFAGLGGVCIGIEQAYVEGGCKNRYVDLAVNHWDTAVAVHQANHPLTRHLHCDVWEVDPATVLPGRHIAYLHASPDCFPAGTMVLTEKGYRAIESIQVGDRVFTHRGRWMPVTRTYKAKKPLISIRTHGHPGLLVSEEHPFLSRQRTYKWNNETRRDVSRLSSAEWVKAKNLRAGTYRYSYADGRKGVMDGGHFVASPVSFEPLPIPKVRGRGLSLDARLMWLAGRYVGDGWTRLGNGRAELVITCGMKEVDQLRELLNAWPRVGGRSGFDQVAWHERRTSTAYQFSTSHKGLVEWLRSNFGHRAEAKYIPGWALGMESHLRGALLTGYLSADGCDRGKTQSCSSVSKALAFGIRDLAGTLGHRPSVYLGHGNSVIQGRKVNARQAYEVRWFHQVDPKRCQTVTDGGFRWCPIREIANAEKTANVFNISVEEDESYVVEGIVVHNCTDFSKAKGGVPKRKHIRALADVVLVWAAKRRPDVITLENVEEFKQWGPLLKSGQPDPRKRGTEFERWVGALRSLGYAVEWRELRACDYGVPTTRKRLFVVARCDGKPIVWPEKTHGPVAASGFEIPLARTGIRGVPAAPPLSHRDGDDRGGAVQDSWTKAGRRHGGQIRGTRTHPSSGDGQRRLAPYRPAAECIDRHEPMLSIFATRAQARAWAKAVNVGRPKHERVGVPQRPLKPKTQARMAGGLDKWVLKALEPFIISIENYGWGCSTGQPASQPLNTITAYPKGGKHAAVDVELSASYIGTFNHGGDEHRTAALREPLSTVTGARDARGVVNVNLAGFTAGAGGSGYAAKPKPVDKPLNTVLVNDRQSFVAVALNKHFGGVVGQAADRPLGTVTGVDHHSVLAVSLANYHSEKGSESRGQSAAEPLRTLDTQNRYAPVAAHLMKFRGQSVGSSCSDPMPTITSGAGSRRDAGAAHALGVGAVYLSHMYTSNTNGGQGDPAKPLKTITSGGQHAKVCVVFFTPYYGQGSGQTGHTPGEPLPTVPARDRFALISLETTPHWIFPADVFGRARQAGRWARRLLKDKVKDHLMWVEDVESGEKFPLLFVRVHGAIHLVTDIAMRMLRPRELARAQGFPEWYVIDRTADGRHLKKADQVKLIGNSVCPELAKVIARDNVVNQGVLRDAGRLVSA